MEGSSCLGAPSLRASPSLSRRLPDPAPFSGRTCPPLLSARSAAGRVSRRPGWRQCSGPGQAFESGGDGVVRGLGAVGVRPAVQESGLPCRGARPAVQESRPAVRDPGLPCGRQAPLGQGAVSGNWPSRALAGRPVLGPRARARPTTASAAGSRLVILGKATRDQSSSRGHRAGQRGSWSSGARAAGLLGSRKLLRQPRPSHPGIRSVSGGSVQQVGRDSTNLFHKESGQQGAGLT